MIASNDTKITNDVFLDFCTRLFNLQHDLVFKALLIKISWFSFVNLQS